MKYLFSISSIILVSLLVLTGITSHVSVADSNIIRLGAPFQLKFDQTETTEQGLQIKFAHLTEDSRCPSDVTCVWQGQVKILVNINKNDQDLGNFTLISGSDKKLAVQTFSNYYIELIKVDPYPISTIKKQLSDYVVTLKLSLFSPLKQFRSGISPGGVTCSKDLVVVIKSEDNSTACVKPETVAKLVARGWAHSDTQPSSKPSP